MTVVSALRLRRVYGLDDAGQLLGGVAAKTVAARARTVERNSAGTKIVLWPRASPVNPSPTAYVWAPWVEALAASEGHPNAGTVPWALVALPDLPGLPDTADHNVDNAPAVTGVDTAGPRTGQVGEGSDPSPAASPGNVPASTADSRELADLQSRIIDAESVADSARTEAHVHELARSQAEAAAAIERADLLAARLAEVLDDRERYRAAAEALIAPRNT